LAEAQRRPGPANEQREEEIVLSAAGIARLPAAISRRVVRQAASAAAPDVALSSRHLDAVLDLARADSSRGHLDLPGLSIDRQGDALTVSAAGAPLRGGRADGTSRAFEVSDQERDLPLPGSVSLPEAGVTITAELAASPSGRRAVAADGRTAMLQAASLTTPLVVRYWRKGDRFRPLGAPGRRKLQDVFVDRKVPRNERHLVPVVMDSAGRIVWVAGVAMAEECRVTAPEAGVVILEMRKP
jgi:tRNA(Ile)-lysidine synthase